MENAIEVLENHISFISGYGKEKIISQLQQAIKLLQSEVIAEGVVNSEINMGNLTIYMDTGKGLREVWQIIEDKLINHIDKDIEIRITNR